MKAKFWAIWGLSLILLAACKNNESGSPEYKDVYSVDITGLNKKRGQVKALIVFKNPHDKVNFKMTRLITDIQVDGEDIGTYVSGRSLGLNALSELKAPLEYAVDNERLKNENGEYASSYTVKLTGEAIFTDQHGQEYNLNFEHKETVNPVIPQKDRRKLKADKKADQQAEKAEREEGVEKRRKAKERKKQEKLLTNE